MSEFNFKPCPLIPLIIKNENGEIIKTYSLNVSSEEFVSSLVSSAKSIEENFKAGNIEIVKDSIKNHLVKSLGVDDFDFLFESFQKNIFALISLSSHIAKMATDHINAIYKP